MNINKKLLSGAILLAISVNVCASVPEAACQEGQAPTGSLQPERIAIADNTAAGLYEGPVWLNGRLYFSHFLFAPGFPSSVLAYDGKALTRVLEDSGTNGLALNEKGELISGNHKYKAVSRLDLVTGGHSEVAAEYQGNVFNSPNDLAVARDGTVYFTDPDFQREAAPGGQPVTGVYQVRDGQVSLIDDTIANPNGISLSPDQRTLYVAGGGEQGYVRAYDLTGDFPYPHHQLLEPVVVPDGMAVDCLGNLYVTEHTARKLRVINPEGEEIARAQFDANVTNAAFGGEDGKTLFVTGMGALWKIELDVAGMPY